jgi:hypothetical protein
VLSGRRVPSARPKGRKVPDALYRPVSLMTGPSSGDMVLTIPMRAHPLVKLPLCLAVLLACVDTSKLNGYECDSSGRCTAVVNPPGADSGAGEDGGSVGNGCTPSCSATQRCIDSRCVDVSSLKDNGAACSDASECRSAVCADGYCCNTACDGPCESCAELTSRGVCTAARIGEIGTPSCAPFLCGGTSGACATGCTSTVDCAAGFVCDAAKKCVPKKDTGSGCVSGSECKSGFCSDTVCCDSACSGNCDTCSGPGAVGQCKPLAAGAAGVPACPGPVSCNGSAVDCPISCGGGNPACPAGFFCNPQNQLCSAQRDNGTTCAGAGECKSGQCVDGVCCNSACAGACDACSVAQGAPSDGTCAPVGPRRVCRAAAGACDVAEACSAASADCPADTFQTQGSVCSASQGDCDVAEACTGSSAACPANALKPNGTLCRGANGVCDAAEVCNGSSASCPADGFLGSGTICGAAQTCYVSARCPGNARDCPANTAAGAGTACTGGVCNGSGSCNACTQGAMCGSQSECVGLFTNCTNGSAECTLVQNLAAGTGCTVAGVSGTCNGTGTCVTCTAGGSCDTGNECTQGEYVCQGNSRVCQASPKPNGTACSVGTCNAGSCTCVAGGACDTGNECTAGSYVCQGNTRVCQAAAKAAGTACSIGVCNGSGTCVSCVAGQACTAGIPVCKTGVTSCATGAQTCVVSGNAPRGTGCGGQYEACDGMGFCECQGCEGRNGCGPSCGAGKRCCPGDGCYSGGCP